MPWSELLPFAGFLALAFVAPMVVPAAANLNRRRTMARTGVAPFGCHLSGERSPYPSMPRKGTLLVGPGTLRWEPTDTSALIDMAPAGLTPLRRREPGSQDDAGADDLILQCVDGLGTPVKIAIRASSADTLWDALHRRPTTTDPRPPLPIADAGRRHVFAGKPAALTALGFVLAAAAAVVVSAGSRVPATIVDASNADDYCTVRWVDPVDGQRRTNGVDCYEPAGRTIEIIALGGPLRGEVIDTDTPWVWAFLAGAVVLSGPSLAGWRAFRGRRHRVADAARSPMTVAGWGPAPVSVDIPVLTEAELHWSRIEEVMRRRAELEGWDAAGPLRDGVTPTRASVGRSLPQRLQVLLARGSILLPAAFGVFVALLVGWSSFAAVLATTGSSATVDATVDGEPQSLIPLITPDDLMVRFVDVDGHRVTTLVPVTGLPDRLPRTMRVEYSTAAPFRARSVDYDGRLLGTGVALLGVAVGVGITSWRVALLWRVRRREQAALLGDVVHPARYVLTQDYESNCVLVLFPGGGDVPPNGAVVLLDDLRGQIPPSGPLELRGRLEPGQAVIPVLQGEPLRTASPWLAIDQDELLDLVNAGEESAGRGF